MNNRGAPSEMVARFRTDLAPAGAIRSTWLSEALAHEDDLHERSPLDSDATADVCIVGGGYTGLWTGLELKRRSPECDVLLIDGDICGGGASGRNGGFAMTWWSKFLSLQKLAGTEGALELARRSEEAVAAIGSFCAEHGIDAHFHGEGWLWTATNREQIGAWDATLEALDRAGVHPFQRLGRDEVAERSGSPVHLAGIFEPSAATVQPALLARGMARVAAERGVRIHEQTPMTALYGGPVPRVRTPHGLITARKVVIATNAWAAELPQFARRIVVIASDVIATRRIPDRLKQLGINPGLAISDSRRLINYYRLSEDGRMVFGKGGGTLALGARIGPSFHRPSDRAEVVRRQFEFVYPMLWDAPIEASWRGPVDYSITGLPFFCHLDQEPNILVGTGFSGNGVGPARLAGEVLAEIVLEQTHGGVASALCGLPTSHLPPEPMRYAGGLVVRAAVAHKEMREDLGRPPSRFAGLVAKLDPTSFVDRGDASSLHSPSIHGSTDGISAIGDSRAERSAMPELPQAES